MGKKKHQQAKKIGFWALLFAPLVWLMGPMSRENGYEWVKGLLWAILIALVVRWIFIEPFKIPSGSMEPTLHGDPGFGRGDRVFVNKLAYGLRFPFNHFRVPFTHYKVEYTKRRIWDGPPPKRFDIVVFKSIEPESMHDTLIKRVIGLPGERVHIGEDGKIRINGEILEMPDELANIHYTRGIGMRYGVWDDDAYALVPEGHVLLLGDNSKASRDGRYWGWVPFEHILGRTYAIWWPPQRWRDFTGFTQTWWWKILLGLVAILSVWRLLLGRSWRVEDHPPEDTVQEKDHLLIDRVPLGVPIPFTHKRLTGGRPLRKGELVLFAPLDGDRKLDIAVVEAVPGEKGMIDLGKKKGLKEENVPNGHVYLRGGQDCVDSMKSGPIPRERVVGVAKVIWWPVRRAGKLS